MKTEIDRIQLEEDIERACWWTDIESTAQILERSLQLWDRTDEAVISANIDLNEAGIQEIRFYVYGPIVVVKNEQTDQVSIVLRSTRKGLQPESERLWINFVIDEPSSPIIEESFIYKGREYVKRK